LKKENTMSIIIEVAAVAGIALASGVAFSPKFRATVGILFGRANAKATTPLERQQYALEQAQKKVQALTGSVANAKAGAVQAADAAKAAKDELAELENQFTTFSARLSADAQNELALKIAHAEERVHQTQQIAEDSNNAAEMALKAFNTARGQLKDAAEQVQSNEQKAEATKVLKAAAQLSEDVTGATSSLGQFNKANAEVNHDYIAAQERLKMSQGTSADQELAAVARQSAADAVKARLAAKAAGTQQ
jgi:hypothetical protein